jgi:hypothetical protein
MYLMRTVGPLLIMISGPFGPYGSASAQCLTAEVVDVEAIVATCCEGVVGECKESFPASCSHSCARLVVPYADKCGEMLTIMGDDMFPNFSVTKFTEYSGSCRQTLVLYERANTAGSCTEGEGADGEPSAALQARVDARAANSTVNPKGPGGTHPMGPFRTPFWDPLILASGAFG